MYTGWMPVSLTNPVFLCGKINISEQVEFGTRNHLLNRALIALRWETVQWIKAVLCLSLWSEYEPCTSLDSRGSDPPKQVSPETSVHTDPRSPPTDTVFHCLFTVYETWRICLSLMLALPSQMVSSFPWKIISCPVNVKTRLHVTELKHSK